jgi:hypothetical protein
MITQIFKILFMVALTFWHWIVYLIKYLWRMIS